MKKNLFICSPNLGILDTVLPFIRNQKEIYSNEYSILFTKPNTSKAFKDDVFLVRNGRQFFNEFIFISNSGTWFRVKCFNDFQKINAYQKNIKFLISKLENYQHKFHIIKFINFFFKKFLYLNEQIFFKKYIIELEDIIFDFELAIYDVLEIKKNYFKDLRYLLKDTDKVSIMHGISILRSKDTERITDKNLEKRLKVLAFSRDEINFFTKLGLKKDDVLNAGIFKHRKNWIQFIKSKRELHQFQEPVVIFSRAESEYFNLNRKRKALEDIKKIIIQERKFKIIIKTHFKSKDINIYSEVFGKENFNETWSFSDDHQFNLGSISKFTITFYSSICIDMLRLGIPNIEYLDLRGLKNFDNEQSLRDNNNNPVFDYRYNDVVIPAQDLQSLRKAADIAENLLEKDILKKYYSFFPKEGNSYDFLMI